ncbi:DMT family transporter [Marinagarivorans algicola]|uniref:DMT family transporter n=1 Tax=Marinagarivorans algicola TaxID=1513270 RepID=UPI000A8ED6CE|nr:DMT family transporter [Marinagarivorans algicola]
MTSLCVNSIKMNTLPTAQLMLLLTAIFWGTSYGLAKEVLLSVSVAAFLAIRFFITVCFLVPLYLNDYRKGLAKDWLFALPTGIILLCIFLAESYGIVYTTASNAAFLISLCIIITPFIEWCVFKVFPGRALVLLACMCLCGVFLLTEQNYTRISLNKGDLYILLAALLRACMVVCTKVLMKDKVLSSICLTTLQSGVVAVGAITLLCLTPDFANFTLPDSPSFWFTTLYLVVFCTIFAFFAQNYGVRHTSPSRASLLMGTEPAFGALFAMYWLGDTFTVIQAIGGVIIVLASLAATVFNAGRQ